MEELKKSTQELPLQMAWVAVRYQLIQYAVVIRSAAHLMLIKADRHEDHAALLTPIEIHANSIIQRYAQKTMLEFEQILGSYIHAPNADNKATSPKDTIGPGSQRDEQSVADLLLHIAQQLHEIGLRIREYVERYKAAHLPSAEQQEELASLERSLNNYFEVLNVILGDMLLRRIRHTPH